MIVIKPDQDRRIQIPGVPAPVRRPVDIDQASTGFAILRTLRIYRFDRESVIEGHAEEDEVFIVVLAGSVELTMTDAGLHLSATIDSAACVAYLPPHAAYKLIAKTDAEVAYARATPSASRPATFISCAAKLVAPGVTVLLEEAAYADRLRLRIVQFDAGEDGIVFAPLGDTESEALVHVRCERGGAIRTQPSATLLESWGTLAATSAEDLTLHFAPGSSGLALIVTAI